MVNGKRWLYTYFLGKMATSAKPYYDAIRSALEVALCLRNFPSQQIERQNRPEIEDRGSKELLLPPVTVAKNEKERVFIEPSINSCRVSVRMKQADELETLLAAMFVRFIVQRAEQFVILRRKPVEGYDISFLITHSHLERLQKHNVIGFVLHFLSTVDSELSAMKLASNSRARAVARTYMEALAQQ